MSELSRFQSAPGDEAGRNMNFKSNKKHWSCFNPLPAMKPGGTHAQQDDGLG